MKKIYYLLLTFLLFLSFTANAQGPTCEQAEPFCAAGGELLFPNTTNVPSTGLLNCLGSIPNPAWFYLQVSESGDLEFEILQNSSFDAEGNPNGTGIDVDFAVWGPYSSPDGNCDAIVNGSTTPVDCSYSGAAIEFMSIPNAQAGEYYIVLITNYTSIMPGTAGFIRLTQINLGQSGAGETDCSIFFNLSACDGEVITINTEIPGAVNYLWEYDDGSGYVVIFNGNFPSIDVTESGFYRVTATLIDGTSPEPSEYDVTFFPNPEIEEEPEDIFLCDNGNTDGIFDLTPNGDLVLGLQPIDLFNITYHLSLADAENGTNAIDTPDTYEIVGANQTIYIRIADLQSGTCVATASFDIFFAQATVGPMEDVAFCDDNYDGNLMVDLSQFDDDAYGTQDPDDYEISYHSSEADAENGVNELPEEYLVIGPEQTIYVRLVNLEDDTCFAVGSFVIEILPIPFVNSPTPLASCDTFPNDGEALFDLTDKDDEITGGNPDTIVTYHETEEDAVEGENEIIGPFTSGPDTLYVRIENDDNGCFQITTLQLIVNPAPEISEEISDYELCDNDQDGVESFDLTAHIGYSGSFPVTFYNSLADAEVPENAIVNPEDYISAGAETIYFRVDNTTTGCYTISSFNLIILPDPVHGIPEPYAICEDVSEGGEGEFDLDAVIPSISLDNELISVTFYEDEDDAIAGLDAIEEMVYTNTTPYLQTIYVRVRDINTGCFVVITLDLVVNEIPEITTPDALEICDPDNDGSGEFNLTLADDQITGGDPNLSVTYHDTLENAELGLLPLASPYTNPNTEDDYNQILYVRVEDQTTGCFNTTTLELIVYDSPQLIAPEPLIGCDDNNDGIAIFDLTQVADGIFGNYGEDWDTQFSIFYYETQNDADNGTNPIPNPGSYANLSNPPQTIYIVAEDLDNECQKQTTLTLIVNPAPELNEPDPLELCDYNEPAGVEEFDLALAIPQITGGDTGIGVSFHLTQAEADNNENPLPPLYPNVEPYAQTIFVRATNATTGCTATTVTLTLRVNPLPSPEEPEPLVVCDTNINGYSAFDLESKTEEILNGEADVIITYHEILPHAEEGIFAIDTDELYENIIPFEQTIYVRAENTITGCYTIVELLLIVEDAPTIPLTLEDLIACSEGQEEIGVLFDLTQHLEAIYGEQSDEDFSVTFHISEEDAENQDNAIANPESYPNIVNPQQIWYVLSNDQTGCGNTGHFWIRVELPPDIIDPDPLEICDDEIADGITVFNLTDKNEEITQGQNWLDVQYYENEIDALEGNEENRINPDTAYTNLTNLQLLYVRVVDIDTGCEAHTTLLLRVLNNPDIITPAPLEACDDTDPGNGIESFNLRDREDELLNGEVGVMVTYHESYEDAVAGTPAIDDPEDYEMTAAPQQIIYVRVTYDTTGCYSIVELLLIVHPLPQVEPGDIPDYILCLIPAVEQASFNLLEKRQEILDLYAPNQDDYQVTFHLEEAWAEAGIQSIPEFQLGNYLNLSNPQTIYYRIVHQTTSCANVGSFTLEIREGATITAPTAPLETCEDEQGSGIGTFNLTQLNGLLLGGQDPDVYQVTYHESEEDANATDANDTSIPNPESYQSGNAVIWGRVTNNDGSSQGLCYEITPITLQVNPLPEISLLSEYRLCVDEDGNAIQEEFGEQSPPLIDTGLPADQYSFVWLHNGQVLFGENGPSIVVTQEGEYTVIVTDITTGCENQASTTVILSSPPLDYGAETTTLAFANEHIIEAWAEGLGEYMFQLDDGPFQDEGYWADVSPGIHVVTITDINGCGSIQIEVGVIDYPLFFTPNEDGYHDTWNIIGIGTDPTAKIYIFDRHGKLLKQLSPTGPGWDGTYNGSPLPSSDYWFRVVYTEEERQKEFRGHFTLKR